MKPLSIPAVLFFLLRTAFASVAAGGYEKLLFYYAYRIDHEVNDGDKTKMSIAPNYSKHPTLATFNEFTRYTMEGRAQSGYYARAPGNTIDPDIRSIGPVMAEEWNPGKYNAQNLIKGFEIAPNRGLHETVLTRSADIIQANREANAKRATPKNLDVLLERTRLSFRLVHQARVYDQAYNKMTNAQDFFSDRLSIETSEVTSKDGLKYQALDVAKTLDASRDQGSTQQQLDDFEKWAEDYIKTDAEAIKHEPVIDAAKMGSDRIESVNTGC